MDANQLLVIDVQGTVQVALDDGSFRTLTLGDTVTVGEIVVTAANSSLIIDVKGLSLAIPANQRVKITPDLMAQAARDDSETTLFDESIDDAIASLNSPEAQDPTDTQNPDVTDFLQALEGDGDILDALDATAAGGNTQGGSGGGTSFVTLTRIAESLSNNGLSFDDSYESFNDGVFNLRDTTDGVLPEENLLASLAINELGLINNAQPVITGTSENLAGQAVTMIITDSAGETQTLVVVIEEDGTFSAAVEEPLIDGPIVIDVTVTDSDGNPITETITAEVDTTAPVVSINALADSSSEIVTISGSVSGVTAGNNVIVTVTDSTGQIQTLTAVIDEQGNWSLTTQALSEGAYTVDAVATDDAGNQGVDSASAVIDLTAPIITINDLVHTNDTTPVISGIVQGVLAGTLVTINVTDAAGLVQTVTTQSNADGSWSIEVQQTLAEGEYSVSATVTDVAGNSDSTSALGIIDVSAPIINIDDLVDSNQQSPIISGTTQGVVSGTTITITITDNAGLEQVLTVITQADGTWSVTPEAMAEGEFTVIAEVTDLAGNSAQDSATASIDLTAPDINLNDIPDTADDTPIITGMVTGVEPGVNVSILLLDASGFEQVFTATVLADGSFSVEVPQSVSQGEFTVTASVLDSVGNEGSDTISGNIDLSALTISIADVGETNDTTPTISGGSLNAQLGDTVTVIIIGLDGQTETLFTQTDGSGNWSIDASQPLTEGEFRIIATLTDSSGNSATANATGVIDTTEPAISIDSLISANDTTPTITGSSDEIGATVNVLVTDAAGDEQNLTATVQADGTWSVDVPTELAEGAFTVDASVTDAAGNTASDTETGGIIDTQAPTFDIDPLSATNDTTPTITGSSDEIGATVTLTVTDAAGVEQNLTATVQADGTWSVDVPTELAEGAFTVDASVTDAAGNTASDTETGGIIDTQAPTFDIDPLSATNDTTPTITGSSDEIGATVTLTVTDADGTGQNLTATVQADGTWSVDVPTELAEGAFTVDASVTDAAGNTASDTETGGIIDTQAPTFDIDPLSATNDTTPTITGSSDEIGATVTLTVTDGGGTEQTLFAVVQANGIWSVVVVDALAEGEYQVIGIISDEAGNTATDTETGGLINSELPSLNINELNPTNDTTPTITGSSDEIGATVTLTVTDAAGDEQNLTATVQADGTWSVDVPTELAEGNFTVDASVTDAAGNTASDTETGGVIDTQAPTFDIDPITATNNATPTITGSSDEIGATVTLTVTDAAGVEQNLTATVQADGTWSVDVPTELAEGAFTVDASVTDAAGNTASDTETGGVIDTQAPTFDIDPITATNNATPTITGSSDEIGATVTLTVTDADGTEQNLTATVQADGTWSVDVPTELAEGAFTVDASVTDAAGNTASDTEMGGIIDTQAPTLDIDPLSATNDTTPTITGSSDEIGATVTLTVTDADGTGQNLTATVQADGTWSVDVPTELAEGAFTVDASVTDAAGNTASDTETGGIIDTQAPTFDIDPLSATNDTTPTITGSSDEIGATVTLTVTDGGGTEQTLFAVVQANGIWSVVVVDALAEGEYQVIGIISDEAGNTATDTETGGLINSELPSLNINELNPTNDTTPTITGSSDEIGATVTLTVTDAAGDEQNLTATVQADGTWSVDVPTELAEGAFTVDASVTDAAGNTASDTETGGVIDTQAPTFDIDPITATNNATPTITGSSDEIGATVTLTVTDADGTDQNLTATVQADGTWSVDVPTELAEGAFTVDASVTDAAGNTASDTETGGVIDTQAPTFDIDPITATNNATPTITGSSDEIGATVTLTVTDADGTEQNLTATVQADGTWSVDVPTELAEGAFTVDASVTDAAGNTASDTETGGVIDTQAPTFDIDPITATNNATPTITGSSDEIGATVTLTVTDAAGTEQNLTATVQADGTWSVDVPTDLAEGSFTVDASVTDAAGNTASDTETGGVIDTQAPTFDIDPINATNNATPTITGSSDEIGATVTLTVTDADGTDQNLTATVQADGTWSVDVPTELAEGAFTVDASVTDAAGNTASDTETGGVIDTQAPTFDIDPITVTNNATPTITGSSDEIGATVTLTVTDAAGDEQNLTATVQVDGTWSVDVPTELAEGAFTVDASVTDAAGNTASDTETGGIIDTQAPTFDIDPLSATNDTTPTITGSSDEIGATVTLTVTDADGTEQNLTATVQADGTWSVDVPTELAEGAFTVDASVTDAAGNTASDTETGGIIDTQAPTFDIDPLSATNDTTPTITGSSDEIGATVTLTVTDADGTGQNLTATVQADGTWSVDVPTELAEGAFTVDASVTDAAGNTASDTETGGIIDTQAPTFDIDPLSATNDTTPTITGSSDEIGATVTLTVTDGGGTEQTLFAVVQADGTWSVDVPTDLAEGAFTVDASVTDAAGNIASDTETGGVIDTTAPSVSISAPELTNDNTPLVTGTSDLANSDIIVTFTDSNGSHSVTVQTDDNGQWQAEASQALADGNYSVSVSLSDAAENTSTASDSGVVDTIPPALAFTPTFLLGQVVTLSGTSDLPAGSTVTVTQNLLGGGVISYTATTDAAGNWSLAGLSIPLLTLVSITASATDEAGNTRVINSTDFDGTPPSLTVMVDTLGNDNTPEVSGSTDAGEGAQVNVIFTDNNGDTQTVIAVVDNAGNWAVSPSTALPDGEFTVDVSVRDGVGNETTETVTGVIDTDAPSLTVNGVGDGRDVTPEFSGTSNEIGGTVTVTVTDANGAEQTLTASVQSDGSWSVEVPNGLAQGDYTTDVMISDGAGNETQVILTGNIDTSVPVVTVNNNGLGNDANPVISGTSTEPVGTQVSITIVDANGDTHTLTSQVQAGGGWQVAAANLPDGDYSYSASITDAAGNTGSAAGAGEIDTLAPVLTLDNLGTINNDTPTISGTSSEPVGTVITVILTDSSGVETELSASVDDNGDWSVTSPVLTDGDYSVSASVTDEAGNSSQQTDDFILNTNAPSITINAIGETNDTTPTINGTSDAADGTTVTVVIDDGINPAQSIDTTVNGGSWSVTVADLLAEGDFTVTASVTEGGLTSEATRTGIIDTTMPDISIDSIADSNDTTPTISGTASAPQGSIVTVVFNDAEGNSHTVTTQMTPSGTWSVPASDSLAEGEYTVTASVSDQAGNPASTSMTGLIDLTPPSVSIDALAAGSDVTPLISGQSSGVPAGTQVTIEVTAANGAIQSITTTTGSDGSWSIEVANAISEGDYSVTASITDTAGNTGSSTATGEIDTTAPSVSISAPELTNDNTPLVTGTSDLANSDIIVTFTDSNGIHSVTVQTDDNGQWQAEASQALADGNYSVSVSLSDAAGNTGTATDTGVVDTTPPALAFTPTFLLGQLVTLTGTSDLPAGSTITITENLVGGGVGVSYTTTTDANGNWSLVGLTVPLLSVASVTASATDEAGNTRTINSLDFDGTPPTLTVSVDTLTNDNTPAVSGTTDAGEGATVTVVVTDKDGTTQTLNATVDDTGNWAVSPSTALPDGEFTVDVSVRDGVGNETTETVTGVIDTDAPSLTVNGVGDGRDVTPEFSGTSNEIGGTVTVTVTDANGAEQTLTASVQSDGSWSVEVPNGLAQGGYTTDVMISDGAGNETQVILTGNIDTSVPVVTVNNNGLGNDANPVISGTSTEPVGTQVSITIVDANGDTHTLTSQVQAGGGWQVAAANLPDGDYSYNASITDAAGNTGSAAGAGEIDTLAPVLTLDNLGTINNDTPTISGTSSEPVGTVITVILTDSSGVETELSASVDDNGDWSVTSPVLTDGDYSVSASVTDEAGNSSQQTDDFILNTNAPSITINAIGETNDTTPTINGTSDAADGTTVTVVIDDGINPAQSIDTTVSGGSWSVTVADLLAEGDFTVTASVTEGGLTSEATRTGIIDTTMPDISIDSIADSNDTTPTISGTASAPQGSIVTVVFNDAEGNSHTVTTQMTPSGTWSVPASDSLAEGEYTVTASVSDQAGNPASTSMTGLIDLTPPNVSIDALAAGSDVTPLISGQSSGVPAGTQVTIEVTAANGAIQSITTTTGSDGSWSIEVANAISEGDYSVTASITDTAGNTGSSTATGEIDTTAPSVSISAPELTNDNTPLVTGTSDLANSDIIVTFTDSNGSHSVTVQTDDNGQWQAEASQALADGNYSVSVSLSDAAGNTGTATDSGVVDTIPPALAFTPTFLLGQVVTLSGTSDLPAGSTVTVTQNLLGGGVISYTATTDAAGNWSLAGLSIPLLTLVSITASATDEAGNTRVINSTDFDGTPPSLTVMVDTLNNDNTPEVSGSTDAGEGAQVNVIFTDNNGDTQTVIAVVDNAGNWAVSPSTALPDGEFTVDVSVRDGVGNETTETVTGVIDTDAPSLTVNGVGDGRDVTPEFSGTSNEIGGTVTVTVTDANGAEQTLTASVQSDGSWSVEVPNGLAQGDYTTDVMISDGAGNETQVILTGNIDTSVPVVTVNNNGLGNDANPVISGTSTEPVGTQVSITIVDANGDTHTLTSQVQAGGGWQVAAANLPDGDYSYNASITDAAGNTGSAAGAGEIDTLAPVLTLDNLGTINNDTPTISGTSSEPVGTVITVILTDSSGVETGLSASVDDNGDWSVTSPVLTDGDYSVSASVTDEAGNSSQQTDDFILNTNAPSITINAIGETNDTTPTINGTSDAADGTTVTVVIDDGINPAQSIDTTVSGGSWSITVADLLAEGDFTVTASVTEGGLTSEATRTGIIDTTMPDISIDSIADSNDTTPTISGTASAPQGSIVTVVFNDAEGNSHTVTTQMTPSGTWSVPASDSLAEGEYTVTASVSDQAGNPASTSMTGLIDLTPPSVSIDALAAGSDVTPLISGQSSGVPAGTQVTIEVTAANGAIQSITTTTGSDGSWSIEVANAIGEGDYSVTASITDTAGNTGSSTATGEIDTTAPSVSISAPELTNDNTPLVTGTSDLANSDIIVTFTDSNGSHSVTVQTDDNGQWQAEASQALADGNYSVSVSLSDAAGNTDTATDSGVVDTTGPELRIIPAFLLGNLVSLSGDSDLPAGSTVTITEQLVGGLLGASYTATTDEDGNWQVLNLTVPLLNLAYVTASATDAAGNTSTVSTLDFDNTAPDLNVSVAALSNDTTPVISGDTDMGQGTVINLTVVDSDNVSQTFTAVVQADKTWSVSVPQALAEGTYTVTASVRDGVGNLTTEQTTGVVDSVAPSLVIDNLQPTANATPTITGSSNEIGGEVSVVVNGQTLQATIANDGTWQVTIPTALNDGDYSVEVSISDDAGNLQTAAATLSIDTMTPVLTLADPGITNDATPTISGTSTEPQGTEVVIVLVDANGDSQQFTTQVQGDGSYSTSPTADIADGAYTVTATITDAANNIGTAQGTGIVDTLDPTLTLDGLGTFNDDTPIISGSSDEIGATVMVNVNDGLNSYQLSAVVQADGSWSVQVINALNDGAITITANVSDAAGNQASATDTVTLDTNAPTISIANLQPTIDTTPSISGTTDARDGTDVTIEIIAAGVVIQTLTTQASAGQWSLDVIDALDEGSYTVKASVTEDGLTGSSNTSLAIDLTAPTLAVNTPTITNDTTPVISGTSDAAQGTIVTLLVTDSAGTEQSAQATVKANGTWSVALASELAEGSYSVAATIADIAGNSNSAQTTGEIDLTPPTVLIDLLSSTADKTPVVSGAALDAVAGNTVAVTFTDAQGVSHIVNTTLATDLTWQVEASQTLAEGAYTVTAVVTDTAGNAGQQIANAVIDSINPEITIDKSSLVLTQDTTPLISGTSDEANATVEVTFTDANGTEHIVTVTTDAQGDWQAAANTALAEGVYSVKATITDIAGNQGEDSKTGGEVDITPPELAIVPSFLLGNLVSLSGTSDLPEGSVVTITNHLVGGAVGLPYTATVDANGDWSVLNLSVSLLTLAYVEASATDAAGNTTTISTLDFDNTAPELTLSTPALTMDSTPTISGTTDLGEGAQVTLVVTGQGVATQTFSATVQANGSWSVNVPQSLGDGQYTVKASVRDGVGNLTEQTASGVIDTTAPSLVLNTTAITSDDTPLISGTSNLTGGEVIVTIDGQTLTATVAQNGQWQVSANTLTDGTYTVTATVTDQAGNSTTRTGNISVDTVAPNITVVSQGLGNDATPIISGTSDEAQGSTVSVVIVDGNGDTHNLTAVVDINGDWQVESDALPEGEYNVTASITDAAGLTSSVTTGGEIDTVAPVVTVDAVGTINLATPTITGSSDEPAGTVISVDVTDSTQTYSYTAEVQADGSWSIDVPDNLEDGSISVVASVTDLAGNTSTSDSVTGVLNTSAPSIGITPLAATNDTTPVISGTSDASNSSAINLVISNASGDVQTFTATLNSGVWSVEVPQALLEGSYTVSASVTEVGLTSSASTSLVIDLTAPTLEITSALSSADSTPLISGTSLDAELGSIVEVTILDSNGVSQTVSTQVLANGNWSVVASTALAEGDAQVTAVITDTAGNSSNDTITLNMDYTGPVISVTAPAITNDWTPLITGTVSDAPAGTLLTILITDSAGSKQTITTTSNADGSWSAEAIHTLSDGQYTVQVSAADELGNNAMSATTGIIDTVEPVISIISGLNLTADATPLISGTSNEPGGIITVMFSDGTTEVEVTTTADALGNWSISPNADLTDANYTVTAEVADEAGNVGTTSGIGLEVDTTPVSFEVTNYYWGLLGIGLTAEGTVEEGSSVYVIGSNLLGLGLLDIDVLESGFEVQPNIFGEWSALLSVLDLGSWLDYRFVTVDEAGNYLVKDILNNVIDQGNEPNLATTSADIAADATLGAELIAEQQSESEIEQASLVKEPQIMAESIDLSRIVDSEVATSNPIEPVDLTIDDVLNDVEQTELLALDPASEESSIAFNGNTSTSAEPALDAQNQSEEMIKKLIESGNNQIDS